VGKPSLNAAQPYAKAEGRVYLLVPTYPGCPGTKAVKRLLVDRSRCHNYTQNFISFMTVKNPKIARQNRQIPKIFGKIPSSGTIVYWQLKQISLLHLTIILLATTSAWHPVFNCQQLLQYQSVLAQEPHLEKADTMPTKRYHSYNSLAKSDIPVNK